MTNHREPAEISELLGYLTEFLQDAKKENAADLVMIITWQIDQAAWMLNEKGTATEQMILRARRQKLT